MAPSGSCQIPAVSGKGWRETICSCTTSGMLGSLKENTLASGQHRSQKRSVHCASFPPAGSCILRCNLCLSPMWDKATQYYTGCFVILQEADRIGGISGVFLVRRSYLFLVWGWGETDNLPSQRNGRHSRMGKSGHLSARAQFPRPTFLISRPLLMCGLDQWISPIPPCSPLPSSSSFPLLQKTHKLFANGTNAHHCLR